MKVDPRLMKPSKRRRPMSPREFLNTPIGFQAVCRDETDRCGADGECLRCNAASGERCREKSAIDAKRGKK